jgi:ferredoxin-NADP reductase
VPLAGQFVVLRLRPKADAPPVLRSYSLSGLPDARRYRISVKEEPHGVASTYVSTQLRTGDVLDVSEPRGAFTLRRGNLPAVLLSAGVGVTPVIAMLLRWQQAHAPGLVDFWRAGRGDHPFARKHAIWLTYPTPGATCGTGLLLTDWVSISMRPAVWL